MHATPDGNKRGKILDLRAIIMFLYQDWGDAPMGKVGAGTVLMLLNS